MGKWPETVPSWTEIKSQPVGRWIVAVAGVIAIASIVAKLLRDAPPYTAVRDSLILGVIVMVALAIAERLWADRKVSQANVGPAGAGVSFRDEATMTVEKLNKRVTDQMGDVNQRLYDLESEVFKSSTGDEPPTPAKE